MARGIMTALIGVMVLAAGALLSSCSKKEQGVPDGKKSSAGGLAWALGSCSEGRVEVIVRSLSRER